MNRNKILLATLCLLTISPEFKQFEAVAAQIQSTQDTDSEKIINAVQTEIQKNASETQANTNDISKELIDIISDTSTVKSLIQCINQKENETKDKLQEMIKEIQNKHKDELTKQIGIPDSNVNKTAQYAVQILALSRINQMIKDQSPSFKETEKRTKTKESEKQKSSPKAKLINQLSNEQIEATIQAFLEKVGNNPTISPEAALTSEISKVTTNPTQKSRTDTEKNTQAAAKPSAKTKFIQKVSEIFTTTTANKQLKESAEKKQNINLNHNTTNDQTKPFTNLNLNANIKIEGDNPHGTVSTDVSPQYFPTEDKIMNIKKLLATAVISAVSVPAAFSAEQNTQPKVDASSQNPQVQTVVQQTADTFDIKDLQIKITVDGNETALMSEILQRYTNGLIKQGSEDSKEIQSAFQAAAKLKAVIATDSDPTIIKNLSKALQTIANSAAKVATEVPAAAYKRVMETALSGETDIKRQAEIAKKANKDIYSEIQQNIQQSIDQLKAISTVRETLSTVIPAQALEQMYKENENEYLLASSIYNKLSQKVIEAKKDTELPQIAHTLIQQEISATFPNEIQDLIKQITNQEVKSILIQQIAAQGVQDKTTEDQIKLIKLLTNEIEQTKANQQQTERYEEQLKTKDQELDKLHDSIQTLQTKLQEAQNTIQKITSETGKTPNSFNIAAFSKTPFYEIFGLSTLATAETISSNIAAKTQDVVKFMCELTESLNDDDWAKLKSSEQFTTQFGTTADTTKVSQLEEQLAKLNQKYTELEQEYTSQRSNAQQIPVVKKIANTPADALNQPQPKAAKVLKEDVKRKLTEQANRGNMKASKALTEISTEDLETILKILNTDSDVKYESQDDLYEQTKQ